MKINAMHLFAFGPFTDAHLEFGGSDGTGGFHMVYGPNEAGKSSALRAVRCLFFGIPVRTSDDFLHPNPKLRLGAALTRSDGKQMAFIRRKGQAKTLRGPDGETVLAEADLKAFLGGIDQALFEQMFAIGHEDLVRGGQEIVAGGGSVGQALFTAGAGLIRLRDFQKHLDDTADGLFKPSGSKPRINQTLTLLSETRKREKAALLLLKTWKFHHEALETARERLSTVQGEITRKKQESGRLKRVRTALPWIARKKEIAATLAQDPDVPELSEDFADRRRKIEKEIHVAANDLERTRHTLKGLEERLGALATPDATLDHAELIEILQQELGKYRSAQKDRPDRVGRMRTFEQQAADKLSALGDTAISLMGNQRNLSPSVVAEIQALGQTHERLTTRLETSRERVRKIETLLSARTNGKSALSPGQDVTHLKRVLKEAQEAGPVEKQLSELFGQVDHRGKSLKKAFKRLSLWSGETNEMETLPCPSLESIDRFDARFSESRRAIEKLDAEIKTVTSEILDIELKQTAMTASQEVPTETDLFAARSVRQSGWRLIRDTLEGHPPLAEAIDAFVSGFEKGANLPDNFEKSVDQADHIADRLRREADQVSQKSLMQARREQIEKSRDLLIQSLDAARNDHTALDRMWRELWLPAGIAPASPREMAAWLREFRSLRDKWIEITAERNRADILALHIRGLVSRLSEALGDGGPATQSAATLSGLMARAEAHVAAQEALKQQMEKLETEAAALQNEHREMTAAMTDLEKDLAAWRLRWGACVQAIGLSADVGPTAAMAVIESLREAKKLKDDADVLKKRIDGIDRDAATFRGQVADLTRRLAPDLADEPPERAAVLLNARLTQAREIQAKRKSLEKQVTLTQADCQKAEKRVSQATVLGQALCREARCQEMAALEAIEKRAVARRRMRTEQEDLATRLREISAGATVTDFITEAEKIDADGIGPELEKLDHDIQTLERERSDLDQTIGTERSELKRMDGGAEAAEAAEQAERLLARLEADVETYCRTRIASIILSRTIERYREKHQGPLIGRAGTLFSRMTLASFSGVRAEYDDKGNPVLKGIRSQGDEPVAVSGMSDGTADQLYLALRLAGLEQYLQTNEPLPFVVDDILLRFDDARCMATLEVLREVSEKTQVIFFTHHRHLVELAEKQLPPSMLGVHVLNSSGRDDGTMIKARTSGNFYGT